MSKTTKRLAALIAGAGLALLLGEVSWRLLGHDAEGYSMYFRDRERRPVGPRATVDQELAFRLQIQVAWPSSALPPGIQTAPKPGELSPWFGEGYAMPRSNPLANVTWQPGARFFICYTGPRQDYFDPDGCVEYRFNQFGIRDREDLTLEKPPATRRVVCLGDSFTLGWGVRQQQNWPVLVESELRRHWPAHPLQVLNCGGAGSAYVDEYALALAHRFGRFDPDLVLVTLCLNDLILTNGKLCHYATAALPDDQQPEGSRPWWTASRLLGDLRRSLATRHALDFAPDHDLVGELMALPAEHVWYRQKGETPAVYWVGGAPQRALRAMRDDCRAHGRRFAVVIWPLLQGTGASQQYPFARLHGLVAEFCQAEGIPLLDLLPSLQGPDPATLWVSPIDMHPNERAQAMVTPALAAFVADQLQLR